MKIPFMKILTGVGGALLKEVPGGELAMAAINGLLPDNQKLPTEATVEDMKEKYEALSSTDQALIKTKEFDVQIAEIEAHAKIQESLSKADISGNSTRPDIAVMFAWATVIINCLMVLILGYAVIEEQIDISTAWPMVLAIVGPMIAVINRYFGKRTEEKKVRYGAISGQEIPVGAMHSIVNMFKRK